MTRISAPALVLALAFAYACAPKVNDPADIEAIKQLRDGYFEAANAKDSSALDAVLADKTILLEPHMKPLVGKDAIGKMHQAFLVEAMKSRDMAFFERHMAKEYVQMTDEGLRRLREARRPLPGRLQPDDVHQGVDALSGVRSAMMRI